MIRRMRLNMAATNDDSFSGFDFREPAEQSESLVICPAMFFAGLSPEQFRAQQQIYQVAYEKARQQVEKRSLPGWGFGENGSGI